jgi:hypothetical protein
MMDWAIAGRKGWQTLDSTAAAGYYLASSLTTNEFDIRFSKRRAPKSLARRESCGRLGAVMADRASISRQFNVASRPWFLASSP